jgi:hypothetical protein
VCPTTMTLHEAPVCPMAVADLLPTCWTKTCCLMRFDQLAARAATNRCFGAETCMSIATNSEPCRLLTGLPASLPLLQVLALCFLLVCANESTWQERECGSSKGGLCACPSKFGLYDLASTWENGKRICGRSLRTLSGSGTGRHVQQPPVRLSNLT